MEDEVYEITIPSIPSEYINLMFHDLKEPASLIVPLINRGKARYKKEDWDKGDDLFERAVRETLKIEKFITHYAQKIDVKSGSTKLRVEKIDMYRDVVCPILDTFSEEMNEKGIDFVHADSVKEGEEILYHDKGILYDIGYTLNNNVIACGQGTIFTIGRVMPVNSVEDNEPVIGGKYVKQIHWNTIPDPKKKREGLGVGCKLVKQMIELLKGASPEEFPRIYFDETKKTYCAQTEYIIPIDLRMAYEKPL
jgi:light-regulated signal transduction histidine kinase (bacteriophytochrome)